MNLPEPATDPFICARCAAQYGSCCRMDPAYSRQCFPLSEAERQRILPHAAAMNIPAAATEITDTEFWTTLRVLFPGKRDTIAKRYPLGEKHWRLPLDRSGKCLFLLDDGCALPREARPWYCQLFPLWISGGFFDRFMPDTCLLSHEAKRLKDVFVALGITREQAKTIYSSLCRDWGME